MQRIHSITPKHFKFFQDTDPIVLNGKNLLLYGNNGSGKSSLFWALYTFLQSSQKETPDVQKYFDEQHQQCLLHRPLTPGTLGSIEVSFSDDDNPGSLTPYRIDLATHQTTTSELIKANLASDFITYRVLNQFYAFSNRRNIDLWPVFQQHILPFCSTTAGENLAEEWKNLQASDPRIDIQNRGVSGGGATKVYVAYDAKVTSFLETLNGAINAIQMEAQKFYRTHFYKEGEILLKIILTTTSDPKYDRRTHSLSDPVIGLGIQIADENIYRPQSFFNEAKLTQIALSIRFGATKANLHDSPIKLLVLDDLLISLDMSNRMSVIDILLNDPDFADYQKLILTHNKGFYNAIRKQIDSVSNDWTFQKMRATPTGPVIEEDPDDLSKAAGYIASGSHEEASILLRKSAEETLRKFVINFPDTGDYFSLSSLLGLAHEKLGETSLAEFLKFVDDPNIDERILKLVIPETNADLVAEGSLTPVEITQCCGRRGGLRKILKSAKEKRQLGQSVINQIDAIKDRILNPAAHAGEPELFDSEMEEALALVRELKELLV